MELRCQTPPPSPCLLALVSPPAPRLSSPYGFEMAIPASKQTPAILTPNSRIPLTNPKDGMATEPSTQMLQQIVQTIYGLTPIIACNATFATNVYTLTPFNISPQVLNYYDYVGFAFVASDTSTGSVTATVVPAKGVLATLNVYITSGSAQAGAGDITSGLFYIAFYVDSLNSGAGGFVIK